MFKLDPRKITQVLSWGGLAIGVIGTVVSNMAIEREIRESVQEEIAKQLATDEEEES